MLEFNILHQHSLEIFEPFRGLQSRTALFSNHSMDYLPNIQQGYLPLFVLIVCKSINCYLIPLLMLLFSQFGVTAITNAISCYTDTSYLRRVYNPPLPSHNTNLKTTSITRTTEDDHVTPPEGRRASVTSIAIAEPPQSAVTELSARTFATWNLAVGVVRVIAAYHFNEQSWYLMSIYTNIIGLLHFGAEAFYWKTARPSGPWFAPTGVATVGLLWHILQYTNYVR